MSLQSGYSSLRKRSYSVAAESGAAPPPVDALEGRGPEGGGGVRWLHSDVGARDSVDTRSHLSAVYTFGLDL